MTSKTTGLASISEGRSDIHRVDPRKLCIKEGWNSRQDNDPANIEHIDQLAQSIAQIGVREPLTVFWEDGQAWVVDGHCRLKASIRAIEHYKAELKTIPVKTEERYASEADRVLSQLVRNSGKPLTILEQGKVYKRLLDLGWKQQDIAKRVGLTPGRISQILEAQTLPEPAQEMVRKGEISVGMAVATVKQMEGNSKAAVEKLQSAVAVANIKGRKRAMPADAPPVFAQEPKMNLKTLVKEVFEYSDVDNSEDDMVVIKMPYDMWNKLREVFKL